VGVTRLAGKKWRVAEKAGSITFSILADLPAKMIKTAIGL
jgi:hypothetical protein